MKSLKESGVSGDDEIRLANALFSSQTVHHPREDVGKTFRFVRSWMVLRDLPELNHPDSSPSTVSMQTGYSGEDCTEAAAVSNASEEPDKSGRSTEKDERQSVLAESKKCPVGRRAAKEKAAAGHVRIKKPKLSESSFAVQEAHMKEITRLNEMLLSTIDSSKSNSDFASRYFELKQIEVLEKMLQMEESFSSNAADWLDILARAAGSEENEEDV